MTEENEDIAIRQQAKDAGIKSWHVKSIDKLKEELEAPVATPVAPAPAAKPALQFDIVSPEEAALQHGEPVVCHLRNGTRTYYPRAYAEHLRATGFVTHIDSTEVDYTQR